MKKAFGKNTLGSGGKMEFHTREFNRSTHNLSEIFRSTMSAGTLVPFLVLPSMPGDTIDIELNADVRTLPTIGPLFGSYKLQLDVFQIPMRLYIRALQMNKLDLGRDMTQAKFPQMILNANDIRLGLFYEYSKEQPWGGKEINNCQIEPSTILSYLGMKGLGYSNTGQLIVTRRFNATTWLMYWDIVKQYYANKQEKYGYYIENSLIKQTQLIANVNIVTGNNMVEIPVDVDTVEEVGQTLGVILGFGDYDSYNAFLEEEFVLKATKGGETIYWKGSKDWTIQRNDSQLRIYFTLKRQVQLLPGDMTLRAYSDISYDYIRPNVQPYELKNIDDMREIIMSKSMNSPLLLFDEMEGIEKPYSSIFKTIGSQDNTCFEITSLQCKQEGLALKTYQSDINNNWLDKEWIDGNNGVNAVTAIQVNQDGKFTLDEFNIKKKVYDMLNHITASGGTFDDWQDVVYGVDRIRQISSPVYEGGLSKEIVFQEVISNSASEVQGEQPLGTLAGRGVMSSKHKGGKVIIKPTEHCYIIGIASITPRIDYSSGNEWHTGIENMNEWHNPYLDAIGYQDLITDTIAFWDTAIDSEDGTPIYKSAGKQPSWINYQTSKNKVFGNFALQNEQMFMVLNRRYEVDFEVPEPGITKFNIGDMTTYIDPSKFNHIFADTSPDAMNFWVQISSDITARRVMSANQIPNLQKK